MEKRWIGIDLGGTAMKLGIVDGEGNVIGEMERPTRGEEGPDGVIARMVEHARELVRECDVTWGQIAGIGVGLPGFLDIPNGIVKHLTNLGRTEDWTEVPIKSRLEEAWQVPVAIDNDANVAALGEAWCGAGAGVRDMVCITLGTGVGGGIISGGRLLHGFNGFAGEIGHLQMEPGGAPCNCGQYGCLETIASATGMVRLVRELLASGRSSELKDKAEQGVLSTRDIFEAAGRGDEVSREVVAAATETLARALALLSVVLNPELFIIGGGVSKAGKALFIPLEEAYRRLAQKQVKEGVRIVPASLGNRAGFIGAAGLFARRTE
jgi:glucokinase